jgi:hypothetical protein
MPAMHTLRVDAKGPFGHDVVSRFMTYIDNKGQVISSEFVAAVGDEPAKLTMKFTSAACAGDFKGFFDRILKSVRLEPSIVAVTNA